MKTPHKPRSSQRGLSLVELMVSMTIGLFILAGVLGLFVGSRQASRAQEALSRVQDSGRYALDFVSYAVRHAGNAGGCTSGVNNLLDEGHASYVADYFDLGDAVRGWNDSAGPHASVLTGYLRGDVLLLKSAARQSGATASGNTPANANTINLTGASGIDAGTILLVADAQGCDLFQNRSNASASNLTRGAGSGMVPGNKNPGSNNFSHAYDNQMQIHVFESAFYYVGTGSTGEASLMRARLEGGAMQVEEVVDGIRDMQVRYGVDNGLVPDRVVDAYVDAAGVTDWSRVLAVRVSFLAASDLTNVTTAQQTLFFNDASVAMTNNRLGQVFTATTAVRNRLP